MHLTAPCIALDSENEPDETVKWSGHSVLIAREQSDEPGKCRTAKSWISMVAHEYDNLLWTNHTVRVATNLNIAVEQVCGSEYGQTKRTVASKQI